MDIQLRGTRGLTEDELFNIQRISEKSMKALERILPDAKLTLVIKKQAKKGAKPQYNFQGRVDHPSLIFKAEALDWELAKALHKMFNKLETEAHRKSDKY